MRKVAHSILFSMLGMGSVFAQDPELSQFYASPLYTNPAFAGASKKIRIATNARNQYTALNNNYKTAMFSADAYLPSMKSGLGVMGMYDVAGDGFLTTTAVTAIYSYNLDVSRTWAVNAAIAGGVVQKQFDFSKFTFEDQIDPVRGPVLPTNEKVPFTQRFFPNFSAGLLAYSNYLYGGVAVNNLLEPNQSFYYVNSDQTSLRLPRRYVVHGGVNVYLTKSRYEENRVIFSPNFLFMQQRNFYQANLGFYLKNKALTAGLWFRQTSTTTDALIFLIGFKTANIRMGYSYDLVVSSAHTATVGSHELSLIFEINPPHRRSSRFGRMIKCPDL